MSFEKGDKVIHVIHGEGVVIEIKEADAIRPVVVSFPTVDGADIVMSFTEDGKGKNANKNPSIYHLEGYVPPVGGKEPVRFRKGDPVLVSEDNKTFYPRIFLYEQRGLFICVDSGSQYTDVAWEYCKKMDLENYSGE